MKMYAMLETLTLLAITLNILQHWVNGNLTLEFKVTKISGIYKPAVNCLVGNKTYSHGEIFKLDCKTQCVCENGRHACSSLCPKEQLPAPEDTISCRSPRLVEVPGHCCKMWLCENPTSDVYATCHNSSSSPWTPCSHACGLGISTRFTSTAYGCNQLYNLRLCENRKCPEAISDTIHYDNNNNNNNNNHNNNNNNNIDMETKMLPPLTLNNVKNNKDASNHHNTKNMEHRIRKGHDCRNVQHLGPARIRLGQCVSRKLYRPKLCGRCHDDRKCCVPSVSTTIQVELLCPVNAVDPISYIEQQYKQYQDIHHNPYHHQHYPHQYYHQYHFRTIQLQKGAIKSLPSLWDVHKLEPIDQETLQSHRIQIENKFIAVEWIMKCECHENRSPLQEYCLKNSGNNSESNINRNSHIVDNLKGKKHINNNHNSSNSNSSSSSSNNNNNNNNNKNNNNNYYYYYQKHFDDSNRNADSIKFLMAAFNDHYEKNDNNNNVEMNKKIKYNEMSNQKNQHWYTLNSNNSNNSNSINISSKSTILNDVQSDIIPNPILPKRPISQRLHHSKRKKLSFHNNDNNDNKDNVINDDSEQIIKSRRKDYHRLNKRQQTKYQNNEEEEFSLSI